MNKAQTLIVIGAGASKDFHKIEGKNKIDCGMPTGEELINQMIKFEREMVRYGEQEYLDTKGVENRLKGCGFISQNIYNKFYAANYSIEDFVNNNKKNIFNNIDKNNFLADEEIKIIEAQPTLQSCHQKVKNLQDLQLNGTAKMRQSLGLEPHCHLAKLLEKYHPVSIDNFLTSIKNKLIDIEIEGYNSTNEQLVDAGKELIVYYILKAENAEIFNSNHKIWYRWLREAIINSYANKGFDEVEKKTPEQIIAENIEKLQIINFNYDRSLEYYLDNNMKDFADKIKEKIYHPYGWLYEENEVIKYGEFSKILNSKEVSFKQIFDEYVKKFASKIKVIGEDRSGDESKKIFKKDSGKLKMYFLGFSFIKANLNIISGEKIRAGRDVDRIFYTNYNNSQKIELEVKDFFPKSSEYIRPDEPLFQKSPKGVYEALEQDFALII